MAVIHHHEDCRCPVETQAGKAVDCFSNLECKCHGRCQWVQTREERDAADQAARDDVFGKLI